MKSITLVVVWLCLGLAEHRAKADSTFVYAVQISAVVQTNPPQVTLNWQPDPYGATNYTVYRKAKEDKSWGLPVASLSGYATGYVDDAVSHGVAYEYQVTKAAALGYSGYGYIYTGIEVSPIEKRGTVVLVVAGESVVGLDNELARLQSDLIGDGWLVIRHTVSTNDTPEAVRALVMQDYAADPTNVSAVFLLGHVPILQSGYLNYDGHGARPMPADAYYGEMNNDWSPDPINPTNGPSYLPSDVALMVGRVDLANMPGNGASPAWPSEVELLRNYLNKDHNWRHGQLSVPRRALMGNRRGDEAGLAVAASGYRNFEPFVGPGNTIEADIDNTAPAAQRWSSMLAAGGYLWAYGCGAGQDTAIGYLGTHSTDYEVWSMDLVDENAQGVFVMVFGSHLGNWDHTDNIMRSVLATPNFGLACCMSGVPHWFLHHMGLGEVIGYGARLAMNNSTLYKSEKNPFTRAVYIALMGDPTLRMEPLTPPSNLQASNDLAGVHLVWSNRLNSVAGYLLYRANSPDGPFVRLNDSLLTVTNFTDTVAPPSTYTYMVRSVTLQTNFSGSYLNPSQGVFTTFTVPSPWPFVVKGQKSTNQVVLNWSSQAGAWYHVETTTNLVAGPWSTVTPPLQATGPSTSWSDSPNSLSSQRFYRVVSP